MGPLSIILIAAAILILLIVLLRNIRIVPQSKAFVLERLGAYYKTWSVGLHVKVPFIDRISARVSLKENFLDFPPQPVITKDNVTIMIDTVVFYQITDPKLYTYGITDPPLPEIIRGVRASSIRIESTSSTIQKVCPR